MVMRRYMDGAREEASTRKQRATSPPPSPVAKLAVASTPTRPAEDLIDPALTRSLVARAVAGLKSVDPQHSTDPHYGSYATVASAMPRVRGGRAKDVLEADIYQAIRTECPGWDLDNLIKQFDAFLNSNPSEMPRNYSKRFYGFMKKHHERNKHTLPGY